MSEVEEKIKFIVSWYNLEKVKYPFSKQVALANVWIDICTKNEEYEMAAAIKKEKIKTVNEFLSKKRKLRTLYEKLKYYYLRIIRKFK